MENLVGRYGRCYQPGSEESGIDDIKSQITSESDSTAAIAKREPIVGADGNVVDIVFSQNGKTVTLKKFFPGDYNIDLDCSPSLNSRFEFVLDQNKVVAHRSCESESVFNIKLLHEAGHAVDVFQRMDEVVENLKYIGSEYSRFNLLFGLEYTHQLDVAAAIENYFSSDYSLAGYSNDEILTLAEQLQPELIDYVSKPKVVRDEVRRQGYLRLRGAYAQRSLQLERRAWLIALNGLRSMARENFHLSSESNNEVLDLIDSSLHSYHEKFKDFLEEGQHFVTSKIYR